MDHPLLHEKSKNIRQRVVHLLKTSYKARRSSNIVFVCGGNGENHMRTRFRAYCAEKTPEFEIFFPEFAMGRVFSNRLDVQFDIADFEQLVCELSHAVVVFPEAPGSYAETGYFSAVKKIAKLCVLVLDSKHQKKDSFISLGPAKKISENTCFHPIIQTDYEKPQFDLIIARLRRINLEKYKKHLSFEKFKDLTTYELACLIYGAVNILRVATIDDICSLFKVIFKNSYSASKIRQLTSILAGAKYLLGVGDYGHLYINPDKSKLLELRDGQSEVERAIRLSLAELYQDSDPEFLALIQDSANVD